MNKSFFEKFSELRIDRNNLFNIVRLYAAFQVMLFHGQAHIGYEVPLSLRYFFSLQGVSIFFSVSGFLIGLSAIRLKDNMNKYIVNRIFRIYPALWICLLFTLFLLIANSKYDFINSQKGLIWIICQATFVQFFNPPELSNFGVGVVNGSLWTIAVEIQFYILCPFLIIYIIENIKQKKYKKLFYFVD